MKETKIKENFIYEGKIITVRVDDVRLENGLEVKREVVAHPGAVAIVVVKGEEIWLVKQYRYSLEDYLLEIPAGKIDKGENPLDAAKRELEEELGFIANDFHFLGEYFPAPGYSNEVIYLYYVNDFTIGKTNPDEDEYIEAVKLKLTDCINLIKCNQIKDGKTIAGVLKYKLLNY